MKKIFVLCLCLVLLTFSYSIGIAEKYIVTFSIGQSHAFWQINDMIKDAFNELLLEVPVDKEYYDAVEIGDTINEDFRFGSLFLSGSFGNWKVKIEDKFVE